MRPKSITIIEIEYTAFRLAEKFMTWNEPIPNFGSRFPNILESCLNQPFIRFSKKDLYRGLVGKASILFYLMIKNHPFKNGNKRIAVITLLYFLHQNKKWLNTEEKALYEFAILVAESPARQKGKTLKKIESFIKRYLTIFSLDKNDGFQ